MRFTIFSQGVHAIHLLKVSKKCIYYNYFPKFYSGLIVSKQLTFNNRLHNLLLKKLRRKQVIHLRKLNKLNIPFQTYQFSSLYCRIFKHFRKSFGGNFLPILF